MCVTLTHVYVCHWLISMRDFDSFICVTFTRYGGIWISQCGGFPGVAFSVGNFMYEDSSLALF